MKRYRQQEFSPDVTLPMLKSENGDWVRYEDAAARIAELESQLAAMQRIVDGYKDDLKIPESVLGVLKLAYRKHHLLDDSVGSTELSDFLMDTICELIGDDGFKKWLDELEQCNLDNRDIFVEEE